jgi:radical SAM enzyme (TIGR01210 family)
VARLAAGFERVIVECHPAFVGPRCLEFRDLLGSARLEVAIGLETAHPEVLARLNKRMTLEQFRQAAGFLRREAIDLRVFLLVRPPWLSEAEGIEWGKQSLRFAWGCGAAVCSLIPTRGGNGAIEALAHERLPDSRPAFAPPALSSVEALLEYGLRRRQGRVFADLWEIERFGTCPDCSSARIARLRQMNETQNVPPPVACPRCIAGSDPAT